MVLNAKATASASSIWARETLAVSSARMSSGRTACSRVSLRSMRSVARSGSSMGAASRPASTAETLASSRYALAATAACALVQYSQALTLDTNAAISSRSPTDHPEGPRIASCVIFCSTPPRKSGRYFMSFRTSGTGWRLTTRMNANRAFAPRPWPLSRIARRMLVLPGRSFEGRDRRVVLPCRLADRGAHHDLEYLVLGEAGFPRRSDVLVGDLVGVLGDLVDQGARRRGEPRIVERGAPLSPRRPPVAFEEAREQRSAHLRDVRHAVPSPGAAAASAASRHSSRLRCRSQPPSMSTAGFALSSAR